MVEESRLVDKNRRGQTVRRSADRLIEISRGLPGEFLTSITGIIERLDPWEDWALEMEQKGEKLDFLMDVIEAEDLLNEDFIAKVNTAGRVSARHALSVIERLSKTSNKGTHRICTEASAPIIRFLHSIKRGRPLTTQFLTDVEYAFIEQTDIILLDKAKDKHARVQELMREGGINTSIACALEFAQTMDSEHFALAGSSETEQRVNELYKKMRNSDFVTTGDKKEMWLPMPQRTHPPIEIKLEFDKKYNSTSIARCTVAHGSSVIIGHLSRVSGHFCPYQASIRSFQTVLGSDLYTYLRHAAFQWIEVLLEHGEIREEELFSATSESEVTPDVLPASIVTVPMAPSVVGVAEPALVKTTDGPAVTIFDDPAPSELPTTESAVEQPMAATDLGTEIPPVVYRSKAKPTLHLPKHIRYRDVLSALQRSGVSMRPGASHAYVLQCGDKTATMYNPHTIDPAENRRILHRIIRQLDIEDKFIANLNQRAVKKQLKRTVVAEE